MALNLGLILPHIRAHTIVAMVAGSGEDRLESSTIHKRSGFTAKELGSRSCRSQLLIMLETLLHGDYLSWYSPMLTISRLFGVIIVVIAAISPVVNAPVIGSYWRARKARFPCEFVIVASRTERLNQRRPQPMTTAMVRWRLMTVIWKKWL